MEIRLCDITSNDTDIRDYFIVQDGKILIDGDRLYDVIIDTDKTTLHQHSELFDSKDEMFKKAKAFDRIKIIHDKNVNEMSISDTECIEMIGNELERDNDEI